MIKRESYNSSSLANLIEFGGEALVLHTTDVVEHPIHFHNCIEIIYVISGVINLKYSYDRFDVREGEFAIINAYDLHAIKRVSAKAEIAYIHLNEEESFSSSELVAWKIDDLKKDSEIYITMTQNIEKIIEEMCFGSGNSHRANEYCIKIGNIINTSLKMANYPVVSDNAKEAKSQETNQRIDEVFNYMFGHIDETITLEDVSELLSISKYHLSHFIKRNMGFSFKDMLNLARADRAELFVLDNSVPVSMIAERVGFSSGQYFNKVFSKYFGDTPTKYRKQYLGETVAYKAFMETPINMDEKSFHKKRRSTGKREQLSIDLGNHAYEISVINKDGADIKSDIIELYSGQRKKLTVEDSEETIIIIKRKKQ
ncbi:MAG: helix-turn-helix domain-containing protein [Firmicutes bacterium]|nr:helix-turn-helix domain-containing protein [Bacillota bacterium]